VDFRAPLSRMIPERSLLLFRSPNIGKGENHESEKPEAVP
jgi:hypothetical protein